MSCFLHDKGKHWVQKISDHFIQWVAAYRNHPCFLDTCINLAPGSYPTCLPQWWEDDKHTSHVFDFFCFFFSISLWLPSLRLLWIIIQINFLFFWVSCFLHVFSISITSFSPWLHLNFYFLSKFFYLIVSLCIATSIHPSIYLSTYPSTHLPIHVPCHPSIHSLTHPSIHTFLHLLI